MTAFVDFLLVIFGNWQLMCHSLRKNSTCKALKAKSVLHGTTWPKILRFNVAFT